MELDRTGVAAGMAATTAGDSSPWTIPRAAPRKRSSRRRTARGCVATSRAGKAPAAANAATTRAAPTTCRSAQSDNCHPGAGRGPITRENEHGPQRLRHLQDLHDLDRQIGPLLLAARSREDVPEREAASRLDP